MTTERLYEFLILSQTLNYSTAAENLFITQSVLSKHIKSIEKELQVQLFYRTTHGVSLTVAGHLLAQKAGVLLEQCNQALNIIHFQNIPLQETIRIACSIELSYTSHIRIFVSRFMEKYPDIDISFHVCSNGTPEELLQQYDFVFTPCEYQNTDSHIHVQLLHSHGTYAALYPGHPLLSKSFLQIRELADETIIVPLMDELFGPYSKNLQLIRHYTHNHVNCIPVSNLSTALFLVSVGKGIAIVPRYVKNMITNNIFMVGLSSQDCRFNEYLYFCDNKKNSAAHLFYQEFCSTYHIETNLY